ncbi:MAG: hypothetical protein ACC628_00090 [Pirellulaceae bacterium]
MTKWGFQPIDTYERVEYASQTSCCVCDGGNRFDAEFCRHCRAPLALTLQTDPKKSPPQLVAVVGPPRVGKTVYLGMLTDILSRQQGALQVLARGAFSVSLQQQSMSALARRQFPPGTPVDPEGWNWVHFEVSNSPRRRPEQYVMPDISGEAFLQEVERGHGAPVIRAFLSKCSAALVLVDAEALEQGDQEPDFLAMKTVSYLVEMNRHRRKGWPARPVAIVFAKSDQSELCFDDPEEYARTHTPGLWRQCKERLSRHRFFSTSVIGACAPLHIRGEVTSMPLRIEPRGVEEPFIWIAKQLTK